MKNIKYINRAAAAITAAVIICTNLSAFAAYSDEYAAEDYRVMGLVDISGEKIRKPTACFRAKRISNGREAAAVLSDTGYDCNTEIPTLVCYVGDTVTFEDCSYDNNENGYIVGWDWQYYGTLGESHNIYTYNIVEQFSMECTEPGETSFFLCVKNNSSVRYGCCDPWSDNGNHQSVGINKWFPAGAYWYFTAVRVVVKPAHEAKVHVRYWDAQANKIFYEEEIIGAKLTDELMYDTDYHITDWEGYEYSGWNVQLPDGTIQYTGTERNVDITLAGWIPEKYLNVEFYPYVNTGIDIKYWDSEKNTVIAEDKAEGRQLLKEQEDDIPVTLSAPDGYSIIGWNVCIEDKIQYSGKENPVSVTVSGYFPHKTLNVDCSKTLSENPDSSGSNINPGTTPAPSPIYPSADIKPSGICDGIIEWTETDSHNVIVGYDSRKNAVIRPCIHTFKYRAELKADMTVSPQTFKSGYGFELPVVCSISTKLISNIGCGAWGSGRRNTLSVSAPDKATVYIPWNMTNRLGTQPVKIEMEQDGMLRFRLPVSPVSEAGARKIYTPPELPGTEEEPVSHQFEVYINGGGVGNIEFCKKLTGMITINGDMYSDDFSGADE